MKRILCILLAALMLVLLCSCADKKGEESKGDKAEETKTVEETGKVEEIATAPDQGDDKDDGPAEIGTLPIIFGDDEKKDDQQTDSGDSGSDTKTEPPSTTTKKPPTTTTKTPGNNSGVVETPIIPFN